MARRSQSRWSPARLRGVAWLEAALVAALVLGCSTNPKQPPAPPVQGETQTAHPWSAVAELFESPDGWTGAEVQAHLGVPTLTVDEADGTRTLVYDIVNEGGESRSLYVLVTADGGVASVEVW